MARLLNPLWGDEATGGFAGLLYYKRNNNCGVVSKKKIKILKKSDLQHEQRSRFKGACQSWNALSDNEKKAWEAKAARPDCGWNAFVQDYLLINLCSLANNKWAKNSWDWLSWNKAI